VCGLAIALVLVCFAEIGTQVTRSGGAVVYIEDSFGPMAGFMAWVVYSLGYCVASNAAVGTVLIAAAGSAVPALGHGAPRVVTLAALYTVLAAVNILGVRVGARLAVATTVAKLAPLVVLLGAGLLAIRWEALRWTTWPAPAKIGEAALLLFFAFSGAETAVTPSGEIVNPRRTVPRGLLGGTAFLILLYVSVQVVSQGVLGTGLAGHAQAPLADVASLLFGPAGKVLLIACTTLATLGLLVGDLLATPRSFLPVAENGLLSASMAAVHARYRTPHVAIAAYALASCLFAITGAFRPLAILASVSLLLVYLAICVAVIKLRLTRECPPGAFRAPGGLLVPVVGAMTVLWLLSHTTGREAAGMGIAIVAAAAYYVVRRQFLRSRTAPERPQPEGGI
jgi:basic amino acid/polyamine antiporter, APA family